MKYRKIYRNPYVEYFHELKVRPWELVAAAVGFFFAGFACGWIALSYLVARG